ncbi:MAG: regulator of sigma E protease [Alteromonadaceae bacterium]|jgi:regulator of sigma E protease
MLVFLWNLASFVIALGILVTVHEYGHFWVARRNGITVQRFSIGFGKTLFSWHDKLGTEFVIALIPLGGYVKMLDGRIDDVPEEQKSNSFDSKTVYQRMAVIFAGPAANFIFAVLVLWVMYLIGEMSVKPVVSQVKTDSIAFHSGLKNNSQIVAVNGQQTINWQAVNLALVSSIGDPSLTIETQSLDENGLADNQSQVFHLDTRQWQFEPDKVSAFDSLGITPFRPRITTEIATITDNSAAAEAGLLKGDRIKAIDNQVVDSWRGLVTIVQNNANNPLVFAIERDGQMIDVNVTPRARQDANGFTQGFVGVGPVGEPWPESYLINIQYGVFDALVHGVEKTAQLVKLSFVMIGKLLTGDVSVKNLSGPISIAQGAGTSANYGFVPFLSFLALISINLGVINLLPLPILDGGHLFFYMIELIRGKSVSERTQELGFKFGAVVLFLLMSIALINDISRL